MSLLEGKVAVVTGSTSGIGRASAELFAEEDASVVINGRRRELGEEVVVAIREKGGMASYCYADVGSSSELKQLIRFAVATYGRLDILMNNAYSGQTASVTNLEEQDWDALFAVTVKAAYLGCKYAIPEMVKAGGGSIINTSSVHGLLGGSGNAPYAAAKAALINLTRQMAVDYGHQGIRVNAMCPGRIITEYKTEWLSTRPEEVRRQKLVYPLGRPGTIARGGPGCALPRLRRILFCHRSRAGSGWRLDSSVAGLRCSVRGTGARRSAVSFNIV